MMLLGRVLGVSPGWRLQQQYHRVYDTWAERFSGTGEGDKEAISDWCYKLIIVRD